VRSSGARGGGRVGAKSQNPSRRSSVLANETRRGSYLGCGNFVGVGYTGFEAVGGCDWVARERGLGWSQKLKGGPPGLGLGQRDAGGFAFGWSGSGWGGGNMV
jgi:hypothetical protein